MMPQEIEAKMKVADHDPIRQRLKQNGAQRQSLELETNIFFDSPGSELQKAGKGLRIRIAQNESGQNHCTVTYKGPLKHAVLKTREEIEFTASDPEAAKTLLERLGYAPTLTFQKKRETWKFANCSVELDTMPHLGTFIEIEGPTDKDVMEVRQKLALSDLPLISTAYVSLLAKYLEDHHIPDRSITF
jgi:adenylate cyclase, class 2